MLLSAYPLQIVPSLKCTPFSWWCLLLSASIILLITHLTTAILFSLDTSSPPPPTSPFQYSLFPSLTKSYVSLISSPQNIAPPHLLVYWRPETLYYQSLLSLSLCAAPISPLRSNFLYLLPSTSFFSILLHPTSISSAHYPQIYLIVSTCFVSPLIISGSSAHAPLWLLRYVLVTLIISAWIGSVWIILLSYDLFFAPLENIIYLKITYHSTLSKSQHALETRVVTSIDSLIQY